MVTSFNIPGKLYLAGEYAVTHPYHQALVMAVDRFIAIDIQATSADYGTIQSKGFQDQALPWTRQEGQIHLTETSQSNLDLVIHMIHFVEAYVKERGRPLQFFDLKIDSQLDSPDGKKYGLGSSGAVSVGIVRALDSLYDLHLSKLQLFKLTALAHLALGKRGSFGDIAASTFSSCLYYQCFDKDYIGQLTSDHTIQELMDLTWPGLEIEPIDLHPSLNLQVGWTQAPASTDQLIDQLTETDRGNSPLTLEDFLAASNEVVQALAGVLEEGAMARVKILLAANRCLLREFAKSQSLVIETPSLHRLIETAVSMGGASKTSGAGGGDCGIALFQNFSSQLKNQLHQAWQNQGIVPLDLSIYTSK